MASFWVGARHSNGALAWEFHLRSPSSPIKTVKTEREEYIRADPSPQFHSRTWTTSRDTQMEKAEERLIAKEPTDLPARIRAT
jgi:hypothetical protein